MELKYDKSKEEHLLKLLELIKEVYDPSKIVLFGSQARGPQGEGGWHKDSDFDLLIIDCKSQEKIAKLHSLAFKSKIKITIDAIKTTTEEIKKYSSDKNHLLSRAVQEGITLFERNDAQ